MIGCETGAAVPAAWRAPDIPGRKSGSWLSRHALIRCLAIYRQIPVAFSVCLALFIVVNIGAAAQQHLVGRAIHDLERGRAALRLADGSLDLTVGLRWLGILVAVAAVRGLLQYGAGVLALVVGQELLSRLRVSILVQVQRLDLSYHTRHGVGEMVTRTTRDADKVRDALISVWRNLVETSLVVLGAIALIAWYAPLLALGPALAIALGLGWLLSHTEELVRLDRTVGAAFDAVNQDLTEGVYGVRVIKAFGLEGERIARFTTAVRAFAEQAGYALGYASTRIPLPQVVVALGQVWVLVVGARLVQAGRLDIGSLVASLLLMNTVIFRVETIGRVMQVFADARSSAARIMDVIDAEPKIEGGVEHVPEGPLGVKLRGVRVRAPGAETDVLHDCSLSIAPGEILALVGGTGSGKSTLAGLLPRLVDPDAGQVLVGSDEGGWRDVKALDLTKLRRRVHVVPQDVFLFSDTVSANLRLGARDASEADVQRALRLACAEEIVAGLPEGLGTVIGDRGATLSGGQRQRLTLARAFVGRPALLALDDATSALDAITERAILDRLRDIGSEGRPPLTLLLVASKLSTVMLADRVALLVGGRIVATGTHETMARDYAAYRELLGIANGTPAA
ncbi:MAG: ABC transporter ATP-binding protein [Polyangia bacterium]|jgi:ABC-type multidrug transport system fused ATPase/permease subunit